MKRAKQTTPEMRPSISRPRPRATTSASTNEGYLAKKEPVLMNELAKLNNRKLAVAAKEGPDYETALSQLEHEAKLEHAAIDIYYKYKHEDVEFMFAEARAEIERRIEELTDQVKQELISDLKQEEQAVLQQIKASAIDERALAANMPTRQMRKRGHDDSNVTEHAEESAVEKYHGKPFVHLLAANDDILADVKAMNSDVIFDNEGDRLYVNERWFYRGDRVQVDWPHETRARLQGHLLVCNPIMVWIRVDDIVKIPLPLEDFERGRCMMRTY
ncbi:uncharacterized protein MONBRDRAFT_24572 [Monosiga brevicollis MX1]|uniref:Uncharacterized protein n=1 Tax=Monosiga brevicollis TaxID=81824 RepID=A9UWU7_MONBE|nr:uncharacterized protein MONBRDRAFT_24572 [Monosiga brevicollis MX1]EDQ90104.1 predicted protein [Monosiga brevicollis MX1]|eukprot:XP_001744871.1 hypothetical protein [Monosiga brevicollis MX1]